MTGPPALIGAICILSWHTSYSSISFQQVKFICGDLCLTSVILFIKYVCYESYFSYNNWHSVFRRGVDWIKMWLACAFENVVANISVSTISKINEIKLQYLKGAVKRWQHMSFPISGATFRISCFVRDVRCADTVCLIFLEKIDILFAAAVAIHFRCENRRAYPGRTFRRSNFTKRSNGCGIWGIKLTQLWHQLVWLHKYIGARLSRHKSY